MHNIKIYVYCCMDIWMVTIYRREKKNMIIYVIDLNLNEFSINIHFVVVYTIRIHL